MSEPHCLSVLGPCPKVCTLCVESHDRYVAQAIATETRRAITWLRSQGYEIRKDGKPCER